MAEFVGIEITKPLPATAVVESTYKTEGSVKVFGAVGAPPFVYARVRRKEWYKPEFAEDASYNRGWPAPVSGKFTIEFKPEKEGEYEVTIVATPAPLALPAVGVFPVLAESDVMKVAVGQKPPAVFRFSGVTIDGNKVPLGNHDADSKLLIQKKVTDTLEIIPSYEWVGASKTATISIRAGYKDWAGNFTPKTDAYTRNIELPESPDTPYSGVLEEAITIPLTACGDIGDGAIEIVAKLPDMGDYITQIWNVYATKPAVVSFRFSAIIIDGRNVPLGNHDADSGLLLAKTTADSLSITPAFEWQGSKKSASISIKAGYKDFAGGFTPKTDAYTATFELPDSIDKKYPGQLTSPISVPLTACGGLTDGAIEVVLKISGVPDYISHIWNVYATKAPEEELGFDLTRPTVSQTPVAPGTTIDITCPVKSTGTKAADATAKVIIYEGSLGPGHGTKIKDYDSGVFHLNPGETKNVIVHHTTVAGTIDRRDVEVEIYVGGTLVKESEWDDVFYVTIAEVIAFDLARPTASPSQVAPGATVTITCPVTSKCTKSQSVTAKVLIYEGSIYTGHGALLATKTVSFSISPGQTYNATIPDTAVAGTIDRRDVEVGIYVAGNLVKESEWDDVYYVETVVTPPKADIQNLAFIATKGTYKIGDYVPFSLSYEYKGKAQSGRLVLSLGTGVSPAFFTVQTYSPMSVAFLEAMDWVYKSLSGTFVLTAALEPGKTYNTRAKLETLEDLTDETDTDWSVITISTVPVGVSFQVSVWGVPAFGSYQKWCCYYWDPGISNFVGDGKWYNSYDNIAFSNVKTGGYLAVFLKRDSTVSSQYTSPTFQAVSGGVYQYDVQLGRVSKIG